MTTKKAAKTKEPKAPRKTIAGMVLKLIKDGKLFEGHGKEAGLKVVEVVKKEFPKSKFSLTHYFWYISRYSRQVSQKLGTDHLYVVDGPNLNKKAKKAPTASKAKTAVGKAKKVKKTQPAKTEATEKASA